MQFEFSTLRPIERYKLLSSTITPRPIAWVSTVSAEGERNAAPFSFFNVFGEDPPVVGFSITERSEGDIKDTGRNIRATGEFVVNLVDQDRLAQMNVTAAEFGPDVDEFAASGLSAEASVSIGAPRIAESPVSFECTLMKIVELGRTRSLVLGTVKIMHIRDDMLLDAGNFHVDTRKLRLVGRMQGNSYIRADDIFELPRHLAP